MKSSLFSLSAFLALTGAALAECKVTEATRKFEGADRTIVTMENERIIAEVAPELEGRLIRYQDKSKPGTPLEWLDDCCYHYNGRWEGKPFSYQIEARGPDKVAVTVKGGGNVAVAMLRKLGIEVSNPLDLTIERTMTMETGSTRLRVDIKVTNTGEGVAPALRYMVHSVYGNVPPMDGQRAFWFLPTANGVEFFDPQRGNREMSACNVEGGALSKQFSRFTPGVKADKPRYEPGGWGAVLTSAGPAYIFYDRAKFDFMQYWFGGDSSWHYTFEPQTKPVDIKPGESMTASFTLASDSKDVPFDTATVSYEQPVVPEFATPGSEFTIKARATTVLLDKPENAALNVEIKDPSGTSILSRKIEGQLKPFDFTELSASVNLTATAPLGNYTWTAKFTDGRTLGTGKTEVLAPEQLEKRKMDKALADVRATYETRIKKLDTDIAEARKVASRWNAGVNLALNLRDPSVWPDTPIINRDIVVRLTRGETTVDGMWKSRESARIQQIARVALPAWPEGLEKSLSALGADRAVVRDLAPVADGGIIALLVNPSKKRAEVVRVNGGSIVKRFGKYSETPGEEDDTLGAVARALAVDAEGNIWVSTNARGMTSAYRVNQDGAPFEESVIGDKGAVKKFASDGHLLGTASLLEAPMDLALATADGAPVVLVSYRQVSHYHTTQVREAVMVLRAADVQRIAEFKIPAGSICVDATGRLWTADVAGHVACYDLKGRKQFDAAGSPPAAVLDAKLPNGSPLPAIVRADATGVWALSTLRHSLARMGTDGAGTGEEVPATTGPLWRLTIARNGVLVVGEKEVWRPAK